MQRQRPTLRTLTGSIALEYLKRDTIFATALSDREPDYAATNDQHLERWLLSVAVVVRERISFAQGGVVGVLRFRRRHLQHGDLRSR
jgi:hypothetical protein